MSIKQLSIFEVLPPDIKTAEIKHQNDLTNFDISILLSALAANAISETSSELLSALASYPNAKAIAQSFNQSKLVRELQLKRSHRNSELAKPARKGNQVSYQDQEIGKMQLLYKSPLPGELQARLAYESTIERFLEFLQKKYQIIGLHESNYHVRVFIPKTRESEDLKELWEEFIKNILFSFNGDIKNQFSGLLQTFIVLLNTLKLSKQESSAKGFGLFRMPIITRDQAELIVTWYYALLLEAKRKNKLNYSQIEELEKFECSYKSKIKNIFSLLSKFNSLSLSQVTLTPANIKLIFNEIYNCGEIMQKENYDTIPDPLLMIKPKNLGFRTSGDDNTLKDTSQFCYSCGVQLASKSKRWKAHKIVFASSTQRLQSSSQEKQPFLCSSCILLALTSPLKASHRNIILKLVQNGKKQTKIVNINEYLRMIATKEIGISSGKTIMLLSEKVKQKKEIVYVSDKLGQVQYALAKVSSIFPLEVISDFKFVLQLQGTEKELMSRHLIFIKGLMESYSQTIVISGKDINLKLGDAIRYVEQDLPYLADYTLVKASSVCARLLLEQVREKYWQIIRQDIQGENMTTDPLWKRAKLYEDVAALTGLTYAFAQSLESTAKKAMKPEDAEREVSKLIEKVDDPVAFCYYATLGNEKKISVQARLYRNSDNYFIYDQAKQLLEEKLRITEREEIDDSGKNWLSFYADDVTRAYAYFANPEQEGNYAQEKEWKNLTYNLKLSLYTRFPELVRKLSSKGDK